VFGPLVRGQTHGSALMIDHGGLVRGQTHRSALSRWIWVLVMIDHGGLVAACSGADTWVCPWTSGPSFAGPRARKGTGLIQLYRGSQNAKTGQFRLGEP
jgi:hypothetical protein